MSSHDTLFEEVEALLEGLQLDDDERLLWAMTYDIDDMDNEQLRVALDRALDVRDVANRTGTSRHALINDRIADLECEQAARRRSE